MVFWLYRLEPYSRPTETETPRFRSNCLSRPFHRVRIHPVMNLQIENLI
jgi:hypothetical protein